MRTAVPGTFLLSLGLLLAFAPETAAEEKLAKVGDRVDLAQYELVDPDGKPQKLADVKGKVVFLNFFSYG